MDFSSGDEETVSKQEFDEVAAERAALQRQVDELREKLFMAMTPQPAGEGASAGGFEAAPDIDALLPEADFEEWYQQLFDSGTAGPPARASPRLHRPQAAAPAPAAAAPAAPAAPAAAASGAEGATSAQRPTLAAPAEASAGGAAAAPAARAPLPGPGWAPAPVRELSAAVGAALEAVAAQWEQEASPTPGCERAWLERWGVTLEGEMARLGSRQPQPALQPKQEQQQQRAGGVDAGWGAADVWVVSVFLRRQLGSLRRQWKHASDLAVGVLCEPRRAHMAAVARQAAAMGMGASGGDGDGGGGGGGGGGAGGGMEDNLVASGWPTTGGAPSDAAPLAASAAAVATPPAAPDEGAEVAARRAQFAQLWQSGRCSNCSEAFGMLVRRHHCRLCQQLVCSSCSCKSKPAAAFRPRHALRSDADAAAQERLCDLCFAMAALVPSQPNE
jgi:hypothetical protein